MLIKYNTTDLEAGSAKLRYMHLTHIPTTDLSRFFLSVIIRNNKNFSKVAVTATNWDTQHPAKVTELSHSIKFRRCTDRLAS